MDFEGKEDAARRAFDLFLFSPLFWSPRLGGSHVSENGIPGLLLKEKARFLRQISQLTDIRKNPQIKLTHLVMSVLLMAFLSLHSLSSLDWVSRRSEFKGYSGCTRKMVAWDSTVSRALHWLKPEQLETSQRILLALFEQLQLLRIQVVAADPYRLIGILDGSQMAQHHLVALCLAGRIDYRTASAFVPSSGYLACPNRTDGLALRD